MRVLVTRPPDQAARTAERLLTLGHQPALAPVLEIVPTGTPTPDGQFDLILATSAQAFAGLTSSSALRDIPLACVGEKTAEAGRVKGLSPTLVVQRAESLAERLIVETSPGTALYLAGRERKPLLEERLRAAGWRLTIFESYNARPVAAWPPEIRAALDNGEIDAVLHYSPRSAALALALIGAASSARMSHFCLAPDIAAVCRAAAPAEMIFTASQPDEDSLMTLLRPSGLYGE